MLFCAGIYFFLWSSALPENLLLLARKWCKEGKSVDERAFRGETGSLLHKLINTCVDKFTLAKYLSLLSECIVQQGEAFFDPLQTPVIQFTRGFPA